MGLCCSKTEPRRPSPPAAPVLILEETTPVGEAVTEKKQVFVIAQTVKKPAAVAGSVVDVNRKGITPVEKVKKEGDYTGGGGEAVPVVAPVAEAFKPAPVSRTSSCTKDEVDTISIQCRRLSPSSSGNETRMGHRRWCSESRRSYDFDSERKGDEEEWTERPVSRSSPRTRTPDRDRPGGLERRGSSAVGGRRSSRSPVRRSEVTASFGSAGERSRQPVKMVSVPAREKTWGSEAGVHERRSETGGALSSSPRSRSPANTSRTTLMNENASSHHYHVTSQAQSLSRASSRKAEQSPCRRNPMAEIDENVLRGGHRSGGHVSDCKMQKTRQGVEGTRKLTPIESSVSKSILQLTLLTEASENAPPMIKSVQRSGGTAVHSNTVKTSIVATDFRTKEQQHVEPEIVEEPMEKSSLKGTEMVNVAKEEASTRVVLRTRHSRRPSRDLEQVPDMNPDNSIYPTSYASSLLEDIHSYRHQHQNTAFSLPACLSKACSIIEAVADLSSTSENKSSEADRSKDDNGTPSDTYVRRGPVPKVPFVASEAVGKDSNRLERSLHKYVTVRDMGCEVEPQESAGSNSFLGRPWAFPWEPTSVDSTDRYWTPVNGDEWEAFGESGAHGRRSRGGNSFLAPTLNSKRRELSHQKACNGTSGRIAFVGGAAF